MRGQVAPTDLLVVSGGVQDDGGVSVVMCCGGVG